MINTFGASLKRKGDRFVVRAGANKLAVSAQKVQSILVTTAVFLSSDAIVLAVTHNVDIVFLDKFGDPFAPGLAPADGLDRGDQPPAARDRRRPRRARIRSRMGRRQGPQPVRVSRRALAAQARSARSLFASATESIRSSLAQVDRIDGTARRAARTATRPGRDAGRAYFACLGQLVPEAYRFDGRSRQPAHDGFNAMLNYSYGVLYSIVDRACICAGLDPFLGYLHTDNYNKPSLVFDMIEPFRILAERATVLLFTGRRVKAEFFEQVPGGVALSKAGRAEFMPYYNERLDSPVKYPVQSKPGKFRKIKRRDTIAARGPRPGQPLARQKRPAAHRRDPPALGRAGRRRGPRRTAR